MPLPGTRVIPASWSDHHRPVAVGGMTAVVTITRAGTGAPVRDEETGELTPPPPVTLASGRPARIQALPTADRVVEVGGKLVTLRGYQVSVPFDTAAFAVDDLVTVTAALGDQQMAGRRMRVRDILYGSEVWQRDLVCEDDDG